ATQADPVTGFSPLLGAGAGPAPAPRAAAAGRGARSHAACVPFSGGAARREAPAPGSPPARRPPSAPPPRHIRRRSRPPPPAPAVSAPAARIGGWSAPCPSGAAATSGRRVPQDQTPTALPDGEKRR